MTHDPAQFVTKHRESDIFYLICTQKRRVASPSAVQLLLLKLLHLGFRVGNQQPEPAAGLSFLVPTLDLTGSIMYLTIYIINTQTCSSQF